MRKSNRYLRSGKPTRWRGAYSVLILAFSLTGCASRQLATADGLQRQGNASKQPTASLAELSEKLRKLYTEAKYISFDAEIVQHESLAPGFIIVPGKGVPPGTVFHVLMSGQGDVRADMTMGDELVYSFQISADCSDAGSGTDDNCTYTIREYNHRDRVASVPRVENTPPTNLLLNGTYLGGPTTCSSGGMIPSHIGKRGGFVWKRNARNITMLRKVAHGNIVGRCVVDDQNAAVVAFVQRAPPCDDPAGAPGITWHHTVGEASGIVLRREAFLVPCTGNPVRIRSVHFRNVEFSEQIATVAVFSQPPTEWKAYSVWSDPESAERASAIGQSR